MYVSVEISYYPLVGRFDVPIKKFLTQISKTSVEVETGTMSTIVSGDYAEIMQLLTVTMGDLMLEYPSVFTIKISNTCRIEES